jgi:hypothetical protein
MAESKNKYGDIVFKKEIEGIPVEVSFSTNPFGEHYLIIASGDTIISGLTIEKKRSGTVEFRNKSTTAVKFTGGKAEVEAAPVKREL